MTIMIEDLQMEQLAQQLAKAEGVTITEAVREGLLSLANKCGLNVKQQSLRERLASPAKSMRCHTNLQPTTVVTTTSWVTINAAYGDRHLRCIGLVER